MTRPLTESTAATLALPARRAVWKYVGGLAPVVIVWMVLAGWLASLLYDRGRLSEQADAATVREWLDEARNFRKTLPELVKEYVRLREADPTRADPRPLATKRDEIAEHMRSLAEPTRTYVNQLPLFPEIFRIQVDLLPPPGSPAAEPESIAWLTTVPRPARPGRTQIRELTYEPLGDGDRRAVITCEYRLHPFNKLQKRDDEQQDMSILAGVFLLTATVLAGIFVSRFLVRERQREMARLAALAEAEQHERELLAARLENEAAAAARKELKAKLLQQQVDTAEVQRRAAEAERATAEMRSQLYASIGIMAGSYAHNIKNLLVRPNDLLARCIEADGLSDTQEGMLQEVKVTLGTVTERLQQILRTVRRDPSKAEVTKLDLSAMARDTATTWADLARDKWKLGLSAELPAEAVWVSGDASHLHQAIENLVFNARDATFEMRNHLREAARAADGPSRKQRLLEAASWKGEVRLSARTTADAVELEVRDNGIGMSAEVRERCRDAHFTTKRDNALYEGHAAGMGLGLAFVSMVLDHHGATLDIDSEPLKGATFRIRFPRPAA